VILGKSEDSELADVSVVIFEGTPDHTHGGLCFVPLSDRLRSCSALCTMFQLAKTLVRRGLRTSDTSDFVLCH